MVYTMSLDPVDIQPGVVKYSAFGWCQIRQAFAEELYDAYKKSKNGEFGTKDWYTAHQEGQVVSDAIKSNYYDKDRPMFIGANPDEVDWVGLWCVAWWYSNQPSDVRKNILERFRTSPYPLDADPVLEIDKTSTVYCRERAFYREKAHSLEPNCVPLLRDSSPKIVAFLGGLSFGVVGLGLAYFLARRNR